MIDNDHFYQSHEFQKFFKTAKRSLVLKADDPVFTVLAVSDLFLELIHKQREEFIGRGLFEVYPGNHADPTEKDSVLTSLRKVMETGSRDELPVFKYQIAIEESLLKETQYRATENEPIIDDNKEVAYIINTTTNITEKIRQTPTSQESEDRFNPLINGVSPFSNIGDLAGYLNSNIDIPTNKITEVLLQQFNEHLENQLNERTSELKKGRDQLQSIFDATVLQISVLEAVRDTNGDILDFVIKSVNAELERVTGRDDLVGKFYATEFPGIREVGIFDTVVKTIQTGLPQQMEYYYAQDGFKNWFACMFVKLNDGVVATNVDISARKKAEDDRFKNYVLLQQSEDITLLGSWDFDLLKKTFAWSDGMYRLFDLEKGAEISPEVYLAYATENGRLKADKVVQHILNGDSDFEETLEISVSGQVKLLQVKATVVRNDAGHSERVLGVDMDITSEYAAEERIRKMEAEQQLEIFRVSLSTLEEERHRISESLHNGIGQILYGIKLNLNRVRQDVPLSEFKGNLHYVSELLTDAIRETRRISHELMPTTLEQFGLESAIRDICSQLSDSTKFKCTITGLVSGMEKYLELAVYRTAQELMTNVVKHANATECRVNVEMRQEEIRIQISDNGQGMKDDKASMPGIGLASIRSKIKLLNGDVRIKSLPGKGTSVEVVIPYVQQMNG